MGTPAESAWPPPATRVVDQTELALRGEPAAIYLSGAIEIWIAGVVLSSTDASLFSAAQRLALLLALPLTTLQVVVAPVVTRSLAAQQKHRLEQVLRTGATLAAAGSAVVVVPILLFPAQTLELVFGAEFAAADTALLLLTVGLVVNVASGLCGITLTMSHHEGIVAGVQAGASFSEWPRA